MLMKQLKEQKRISSRLYKYLCFHFRHTPNNLKVHHAMLHDGGHYETLSFDEKMKITFEYFDKMEQKFEGLSLEDVLKELNISQPKDIMQFRGLGRTSVSELEALIERNQDE